MSYITKTFVKNWKPKTAVLWTCVTSRGGRHLCHLHMIHLQVEAKTYWVRGRRHYTDRPGSRRSSQCWRRKSDCFFTTQWSGLRQKHLGRHPGQVNNLASLPLMSCDTNFLGEKVLALLGKEAKRVNGSNFRLFYLAQRNFTPALIWENISIQA